MTYTLKHLHGLSFEIVKPRQAMSIHQSPMRGAERDLSKWNIYRRVKASQQCVYIHFEMNNHPCEWEGGVTLASVSCKPGASMMQQMTVVTNKRMAYL